ncbi:MAG: flagellar M-ring protein FliF [Spirochaetes bacterium]|nr:flagellar M-ring protein FliF [Spirochaetota bacterium]
MNDFFKRILDQVKSIWEKSTLQQKLIIGGVIVGAVVLTISVVFFTSQKDGVLLFSKTVQDKEAKAVVAALDNAGVKYEYSKGMFYLQDARQKAKAELELVKANVMPSGVDGWEIFDTKGFAPLTDAEMDINKRRALTRAITKHLESLDFVQKADVNLTFPRREYLTDVDAPVTASVIITPKPFKDDMLKEKKTVRGLQKLIAMGVDKLREELVTVSDNEGHVLTDYTDENASMKIKLATEEIKILDREKKKLETSVKKMLGTIYRDRAEITINMEILWDEISETNHLIVPVVMRKDNPATPYDESVVQDKVHVSSQKKKEKWTGQRLIPQGAAGAEENVPPGYKDKTDRWNTYEQSTDTENFDLSRKYEMIKRGEYKIGKVSCAVAVDGRWEIEYDAKGEPIISNGVSYQRKYIPVEDEELRKIKDLVKGSMAFSIDRGDNVSVQHIPFDHWKDFKEQDEKLRTKRNLQRTLMISLVSLLTLFVLALLVRAIQKEVARRRRLYEEEQERRQSELRNQALMQAQDTTSDMSVEDQARKKLLEEITNVAKERPEDVAQILRTWMAEETKG